MEKYYLTDKGIYKNGGRYYYNKNNSRVVGSTDLSRLNKLIVPPAWSSVWYASSEKSHIQVHGIDQGGKKQYILSDSWNSKRKQDKYTRIKLFVQRINSFKRKIAIRDSDYIDREYVIKLLFNLLISTHIRVGNDIYALNNKTYGLTTLLQKHFVNNKFVFTGKSNIHHSVAVPPRFVNIIKRFVSNNKSDPLFYYSLNGNKRIITSGELNDYLKRNMGEEYTCKDFRTYSANIIFIESFLKESKMNSNPKKTVLKCIDYTSEKLGHTRNICRKSYISTNLMNYCIDNYSKASTESVESLINRV